MSRYGIAEWFGNPLLGLTPEKRQELAGFALGKAGVLPCPFRRMKCNKRGGVCSLIRYEDDNGFVGQPIGDPVTVCPVRFEQGGLVIRWLASILGFAEEQVKVAREIPFMQDSETGKAAGKIDLVIACEEQGRLSWFGLEIQAVYFSGPGMESQFQALRRSNTQRPPFPDAVRRPDWRSSGAKRLMPQLQVKGPTLRRWHSKIAVAVDRPFFAAHSGPSASPSHDLDDGDVIWLVPEISPKYQLERGHWEVLTLEDSESKLKSANPVSRAEFEKYLRSRLVPLKDLK